MTTARPSPALTAVLPVLRCPLCDADLELGDGVLRCERRHSFDIARQGYVGMVSGRGAGTGDTAAMVAARDEVLTGGVLAPVIDAVATAAEPRGGFVLDLAGGTGHYLAAVLNRDPHAHGLCLDASAPALRRAARCHPRAAAIGADAWSRLPLADGSVDCALSVFGPRSADELARVLTGDGVVVVAAPAPEHLLELVTGLHLVGVDPRKAERQASTFAAFDAVRVRQVRYHTPLDHAAIAALAGMGPTAAHRDPDQLRRDVATLPDSVDTTVAVDVTTYVRGR